MKKFNVGLQLYGVRNAMAEDFEGTLRAVRDMGYEYVEFTTFFDKTGEEVKALLDELGLKCISAHKGLDYYEGERAIEDLKAIGIKFSVIPWYDKTKLAGTEGWEESKKVFNELADRLAENGIKLGYHNHEFEFATYQGKTLHDYIFEAVPADKMDPEIDTCWVRYASLNPEDMIRKYKGRVEVVHLKDFVCKRFGGGPVYELIGSDAKPATREENGFEFRPLGDGIQDFATILKACEECGTETVIVEQDKTYGGMTELEAAKRSRDYLKNTFGI